MSDPIWHQFTLHGLQVDLQIESNVLEGEIARLIAPFPPTQDRNAVSTFHGSVRTFNWDDLTPHLSPHARFHQTLDAQANVYSLDERFWIVDDRWGMCEINLLKRYWCSWVLPSPRISLQLGAELAVMRPLAQLLRLHGPEVIPATSVWHYGWAALILSPGGAAPSQDNLADRGFSFIGDRWTTLLNNDNMVELHPLRDAPGSLAGVCRAIFVVEPSRRPSCRLRPISSPLAALDRAWPLANLQRNRRRVDGLLWRLAKQCRCYSLQLSSSDADLPRLISVARAHDRSANVRLAA